MPKIINKIVESGVKIFSKISGLSQDEINRANAEKTVTSGMPELLRHAAAEGAVLIKNNGVLPLEKGTAVSLFGRVQLEWFYTGYGSGGEVNKPYAVNLTDAVRCSNALKLNGALAAIYEKWNSENPIDHGYWGHWPRCYDEMPLDEDMVSKATEVSDCAVITIGRSSGEDRENALEKGSYYLTDEENNMLSKVTEKFDKTVVLLNIGSIMDMSWTEKYADKISAVLIVWQGGMESGNAVCDLLCGNASPCGRLTDTVARFYEDYPSAKSFGGKNYNYYEEDIYVGYRWFETFHKEQVLYPFGFGLSYTDFSIACISADEKDGHFNFEIEVKNIGKCHSGKEVAQLYIEKPCGLLGNPSRILAGFAKTKELMPGEAQILEIVVSREMLSSYDDSGKTGCKSAYVIEKGNYKFYLGKNVRDAGFVYSVNQEKTELYEQLAEAAAPKQGFMIYKAKEHNGERVIGKAPVSTSSKDLKKIIMDNLPEETAMTGDKGYKLSDVKSGRTAMSEFVAQLDLTELEAISRGDYIMNSPLGAPGNAGVYGGVLQSLREKGIPAVTATDGPSGIRLQSCCSLLPIGTLLASTFDEELVQRVYEAAGREMTDKGSDVLLAPGMNIHRNPLCGRNFEYYSEDPFLTGKIAAAAVKGLQKTGVSACPKHFACNNQEFRRNRNDSRLSERALREIYLKGFEICVKESEPQNIMTSYNKVNGVYCHYQYELCTSILRNEWNYKGCVMTDWWMRPGKSPEFRNVRNNAYRIRAQVDVFMPGGNRIRAHKNDGSVERSYKSKDGLTLGELQRGAANILNFVIHSSAMNETDKEKPQECV